MAKRQQNKIESATRPSQFHQLCPKEKSANFGIGIGYLEAFTIHLKTHHKGMSLAQYKRETSNPFKNITIFKCDRCTAMLLSEDSFLEHLKEKHSITEDNFQDHLIAE